MARKSRYQKKDRTSPSADINAAARSGTQAIERAATVLKEIGNSGMRGVRIVELCSRVELTRPTLHRILLCLLAHGLVARDSRSKRFLLGQEIYKLGLAAAGRFNLREICEPTLTRIAAATGDTVFLASRQGADGLVIDRRDGPKPIRSMPLEVGMPRPLGVGATGLAILSWLPEAEISTFLHNNARRLSEHNLVPSRLQAQIAKSRRNGYAFSRGYGPPGISGIGFPLHNGQGQCVGAISVTTIAADMTREHRLEVLDAMQREMVPLTTRLRALQG